MQLPEIPIVTIDVARFRTRKQEKLLRMLNDDKVKAEINGRIRDTINNFVPKKSGALRASAKAYPDYISWGEGLPQYARYQYYGKVYGPNLAGWLSRGEWGWRSRRGMKKHPTGRNIGDFNGTLKLRAKFGSKYFKGEPTPPIYAKFGYTTPGTHHHWDQYFKLIPKLKTNREITRYLKQECNRRGLKV